MLHELLTDGFSHYQSCDSPKTLTKPQDLCQGKCNSTKAVDTPTALTVPQELYTDYFSYYIIKAEL